MAELTEEMMDVVYGRFVGWLRAIAPGLPEDTALDVAAGMIAYRHVDADRRHVLALDPDSGDLLGKMDLATHRGLMGVDEIPTEIFEPEPKDE